MRSRAGRFVRDFLVVFSLFTAANGLSFYWESAPRDERWSHPLYVAGYPWTIYDEGGSPSFLGGFHYGALAANLLVAVGVSVAAAWLNPWSPEWHRYELPEPRPAAPLILTAAGAAAGLAVDVVTLPSLLSAEVVFDAAWPVTAASGLACGLSAVVSRRLELRMLFAVPLSHLCVMCGLVAFFMSAGFGWEMMGTGVECSILALALGSMLGVFIFPAQDLALRIAHLRFGRIWSLVPYVFLGAAAGAWMSRGIVTGIAFGVLQWAGLMAALAVHRQFGARGEGASQECRACVEG
jgi:hypothetical protein